MSRVLAEVDNDFLTILQNGNCENLDENSFTGSQRELIRNMNDNGFLIDNDFDELAFLEYKFNKNKYSNSESKIVILTASGCNCCCPYCFEGKEKKNYFLTPEVKNAIYKQIKLMTLEQKNLNVTWFGGEPLLAKNDIWEMSKKIISICNENNATYFANISTNGYLIDNHVVENMLASKIMDVQITLDGTPEMHDSIRKLHNGEGTFFKIIENVKMLLDKNISVVLNTHINYMQESDMVNLLDILEKEGLKDCFVVGSAISNFSNNCTVNYVSDEESIINKTILFKNLLASRQFNSGLLDYYPGAQKCSCMANTLNSFAVAPNGEIYACFPDIGMTNKSLGNILELNSINTNHNKIKYVMWSPFKYEKCLNCSVLPLCMGGCINRGIERNEPECMTSREEIIKRLKITYDKKSICCI